MQKTNKSHETFCTNLLHQFSLIAVMNKRSQFIYLNKQTANLFGYPTEDSILGLDSHSMRCPAVECANEFMSQDKIVMKTNCNITILDIHEYSHGQKKILLTKKALYRENEEAAGVICHSMEIHSKTLNQICSALIQSDRKYIQKKNSCDRSYMMTYLPQEKNLSKRELDCIFYLLRGHSMKQIAKKLLLSTRTIETYLEKIKLKLKCKTKSDLIECCLNEGFLNYIPSTIISQNISSIIHC